MDRLATTLFTLTLTLASACGSGGTTNPNPTPTPGDVDIVKGAEFLTTTAFNPNPKQVSLGGGTEVTVRWVNTDGGGSYGGASVAHQITSDNGAFAMSAPLGSGATYTVTLTAAGSYTYHCNIHPNMVGTIVVAP
ncbi:MAG TPA: cupredoxin domain-containing protein [Gemmatimonadales bacterium]|nr:cupredoxin domain-containing protein [Gemmatimonadales bacterium]